ncbi:MULTISPECIES: thioesterase domain-containing protein [unclassified Pseudomonas]|uniref:thioesterase domain-containing protein n=1 Tax=unclassified Pseudomonas TaxID=196821 RepID=UPI0024495E9F|nr:MULTISPECIES: thioesterase domain-containing protein [unclassified Pseudomonas]MDH0305349.1 thioesterase domain-containing protein [Pseudomonas sp. GD04091]MDH1988283.1 thioesterase domain-containing protein [Pseudomonas sp. GD03689]
MRQEATPEQSSRIRLICLACTRQQLIQYRTWAQTLSDPVELIAVDVLSSVQLDTLACAPPPSALVRILAEQLQPFLSQPHAVFGQTLGAHIALALTQLAQDKYPGLTRHLFVSSCDSPEFAVTSTIHVPMTVLYPPGSMAAMLGWHALARRELELIELPPPSADGSLLNQRLVRIFNTHLGLLSF